MHNLFRKQTILLTSIVTCLLTYSTLMAEPVRLEQAQKVTSTFLKTLNARSLEQMRLFSTESKQTTESQELMLTGFREICDDDGKALAYISELEPHGFIAISADTDITPIIAYSSKSSFPSDDDITNPLYRMLKEDMKLRLKALDKYKESNGIKNKDLWNLYSNGESSDDQVFQQWPPESTTSTGGWLETTWSQSEPYSDFCPLDPVDDNRSVAGCIATALAQVVNYHRQCNVYFNQDDSYSTYSGINIDADSDKYDFPSFEQLNECLADLRIKYSRHEDLNDTDVAALNFACGIATQMDYSSEGSGASSYDAQEALLYKFGFYSADMTGSLSSEYQHVLQENIINGLPAIVCMASSDGLSGHAVVCDGYNTNGEYHLNFGWSEFYPDIITDVWYNLPTDLPSDLCIVDEVILEVHPVPPGIDVDSTCSVFYSVPNQESESAILFIKNNAAQRMSINFISCTEGFLISVDDENYTNRIDSFEIEQPGHETLINVKFCPEKAGGYYGTLTINYGQNNTKKVILKGCSFSGGTEIREGEISGIWSEAESPYFIYDDVNISENDTLIIEPGVKVIFVGPYGMTIGENAQLTAEGNKNQPVEFTTWNKDMGWTGLRFINSGEDDILSHCTINYVKKGVGLITSDEYYYESDEENIYDGAIYCYVSSPTITNCKIINNLADKGGAIYLVDSNSIISNTLIANNSSLGGYLQCGGIFTEGSGTPGIKNCTIVNNLPGGILTTLSDGIDITNTIIWGNERYQIQRDISNAVVTYCNIQEGFSGQGNIDTDPCFFEPSASAGYDYDGLSANWTLRSSSQCINSGKEIQLPNTDLTGNPRIYSDIIDIGAYENQSDLPLITTVPLIEADCVNIAAESTLNLDITNTGKLDLTVEGMSISDPFGVFSIIVPIAGYTLTPGDSVQAQIGFSPTEEKIYTGTLYIHSTSSNGPIKPIALHGIGASGTIVPGGEINGSWTKAESPYTVTGDVYIPGGQSLNIEPGVVIKFAGHFGLTVGYRATLRASGSETENIVFTPMDTEEGWFGISFINSGNDDVLKYCTIEYANKPRSTAKNGFLDTLGGGILCCGSYDVEPGYIVPSGPTIDHCLISNNYAYVGGGILCIDSSEAQITYNTIIDNSATYGGGGIYIEDAAPLVSNNIIAHNSAWDSGGIITWYAATSIINNTIVHNRPNGLHLGPTPWSFEKPLVLNNIIWQNEIYISEYVYAEDYDIKFNDIQGGFIIELSLYGDEPYEGEGNINIDPLFADPQNRDYHLKSEAGRWDPDSLTWQLDSLTSPCIDAGDPDTSVGLEPSPNGNIINIGAYGGTEQASKSL
jgi:parallel beta-helix repeat protein